MALPGNKATKKIFDGRYEILSIVGRGSASVVYHARHAMAPTSEIALKVLLEAKENASNSDKLRKEALAMVSSRHKYVVRLDDFHSVGSLCYLSMEYAPESDLRRYTGKHGGKLDPQQGELFLSQAAEALSFIHKAGIVHRDLKPDNILVINEREIRVADFGLAVLPGEQSSVEDLQSGVGTMSYMAPEVLEGTNYDKRSDMYALALTFYEMLTGAHPFDAAPLMKQLEVRQSGNFAHLRDAVPGIDEHLAAVIMRALSYNPADRFSDMKEMAQAIATHAMPTASSRAAAAKSAPAEAPRQAEPIAAKPEEKKAAEPAARQPRRERERKPERAASNVVPFESPQSREKAKIAVGEAPAAEEAHAAPSVAEPAVSEAAAAMSVAETVVVPMAQIAAIVQPEVAAAPRVVEPGAGKRKEILSVEEPTAVRKQNAALAEQPEALDEEPRAGQAAEPQERQDEALDVKAKLKRITGEKGKREKPAAAITPLRRTDDQSWRRPVLFTLSVVLFLGLFLPSFRKPILLFGKRMLPAKIAKHLPGFTASSAPEIESPIPLFEGEKLVDEALARFPYLPAGMYSGTIKNLTPAHERVPLTLLSLPGSGETLDRIVVIVGIEGWAPSVVTLPPFVEDHSTALVAASNGFLLRFAAGSLGNEGEMVGNFKNVLSGEVGEWRMAPVK